MASETNSGSVVLGGVFDLSGSMKAAITGSAEHATRADSVFETLESLYDVARDEVERHRRDIHVFASAVGVEGTLGAGGVCDLLQLVDNVGDLFAARYANATVDDLVAFAKSLPDGARAEYWIRRHVTPEEAGPLLAYLMSHPEDVGPLLDDIPSAATTTAAKNATGGGAAVGLAAGAAALAIPGVGPFLAIGIGVAALAGGAGAGAVAQNTVMDAGEDHPALRKKRAFVDAMRRELAAAPTRSLDEVRRRVGERPTVRPVESLTGPLRFRRDEMKMAVTQLAPFVFRGTPLGRALRLTHQTFEAQHGDKKLLFIVSDGAAHDTPEVFIASEAMRRAGVVIVSCFLTEGAIATPRKLHYRPQASWCEGARTLFENTSSGFKNTSSPVSLLVQAGWEVPAEGECSLFFRANNLDVVNEFHSIVQTAFVREPAMTALGVAAHVNWATYLEGINRSPTVQRQGDNPTCWAHAVGTVVHQAVKRVVGREGGVPTFAQVRDRCFSVMSTPTFDASQHGNSVRDTLNAVKDEYRLRFREVSEVEARQALNHHRPVVARFSLFDHPNFKDKRAADPQEEWDRFAAFFAPRVAGAVASKADIQRPTRGFPTERVPTPSKLSGHAVVLVDAGPDYLEFLNSWSEGFGDRGRFRVRDASVLRDMKFFDVFWYESDLKPSERAAWDAKSREVLETVQRDFPSLRSVFRVP